MTNNRLSLERISTYVISPEELSRLMIERMETLNITQTELARKINCSQASVNFYYNGKRIPTDDSKLLLLFETLNICPDEYLRNFSS